MQDRPHKKRVCVVCGEEFIVTMYNRASKTCSIEHSKYNELKHVNDRKYGRRNQGMRRNLDEIKKAAALMDGIDG
jgi:hypothetical protein